MAKLVLQALLCLALLLQNLDAAPAPSSVSEIESAILQSASGFLSQYEQLKQQALSAGTDITECVAAFEDRFINLGTENVQRFEACVSEGGSDDPVSTCGELYTAMTNGVGEGMLAGLQMCIEYQGGPP